MSGSSKCPHPELHIDVHVTHMGDSTVKAVEMKATCKHCKVPMVFIGMPLGTSLQRPTANIDGTEARFPIVGQGDTPDSFLEAILQVGHT